jgi:hypothetical protein
MRNILLAIFISITIGSYAQYPTINAARPRIYADADRISWMQNNHATAGSYKTDYDNFVTAYTDNWISDPQLYMYGQDQSQWTWDWGSSYAKDQGFFTVYIFKVSNDPEALERCKFIAQKTIDAISAADFASMEWNQKEALLRTLSEVGGLLLDWCYNDLPTPLRNQLVQSLYIMNTEFMNTYILSSAGTGYVSSHNTWNNIICNQNALVLHNAAGLSPAQQATVTSWYQTIYDKHINGFIPCWSYYRDDDGGWNWGAAYSMWSLTDQFQLFENMRIATDKNFFTDLPWVQESINQYWYFMQPDNKTLHLGDGVTNFDGGDRVMYLHARHYNDPRSKWLAHFWSQPVNLTWTKPLFEKLFYKDYTAIAVTNPGPPLKWFSDKVGLSIARSWWTADATMVAFLNSPSKRAAHEHRDNNSFTIFKNAPLLIDSGHYDTYAGSHYKNYYERTIAHNTICVFDAAENYTSSGQPVSNDGGQIESLPLQNFNDIHNPINKRGEWIHNAIGSNYHYNIADAQQSYNPAKVDFFRRRLLYLNDDKVIVLDHVHLNNFNTAQRDIKWLAHFANQPLISGNITSTAVPGHITTHNGQDYSASNGNGNLAIRTLLPASTNTTLIGGTGYEYWVNGQNYPPDVAPNMDYFTPGSWRIEVKPTSIPADGKVTYLHTIDIGDNNNASIPGGVALQNGISVGTDWDNTIYYFAADGLINKDYHVFNDIAGNRTVNIFVTDLIEGDYNIIVDGIIVATYSSDGQGIMQEFALGLSPGNHVIEISNVNLSAGEVESDRFVIYPNPVQSELYVGINGGFSDVDTKIYNNIGQLVLQTRSKKVDVSGLVNGIYIVDVNIDGHNYKKKIIKR